MSEKVVMTLSQAHSELHPQQQLELERLQTELSQLKIGAEHSVEHVRDSNDTGVGAVKNVISAVKEELQYEKTKRQNDMKWYRGYFEQFSKRQTDSDAKTANLESQLNERTKQVSEVLPTMADMAKEVQDLKI